MPLRHLQGVGMGGLVLLIGAAVIALAYSGKRNMNGLFAGLIIAVLCGLAVFHFGRRF